MEIISKGPEATFEHELASKAVTLRCWKTKKPDDRVPGGSNAQHEQCNNADSDHQHHERYGIVIEPVPNLCTHDDPHPVPTAFFWVLELSAASRLKM
jgi:hypothetical protein